jgi:hypothetical protein
MSTAFEYIRKRFGVPAKRGARVEYQGKPGKVTSATAFGPYGAQVSVRLDGAKHPFPYNPTDLKWLDNGNQLPQPPSTAGEAGKEST